MGRTHFAHRLAIPAESTEELRERLTSVVRDQSHNEVQSGQILATGRRKIAFFFTGQGSQYIQMARQLYETQPIFRQTLDHCDRLLQPYLDQSLLSVIYPVQKQDQ